MKLQQDQKGKMGVCACTWRKTQATFTHSELEDEGSGSESGIEIGEVAAGPKRKDGS